MIKGILIDNAGVLLNTKGAPFFKILEKYSSHNHKYLEKNFEKGKHHVMEKGTISSTEFYKDVCKRLNIKNYTFNQFKKDWPKVFFKNKPMERFIRKNYKKYKIYMLTNTNPIHFDYLKKRFPIYNFVKNKIISYKISMAKPDLNMYRYALKKINLKPKEVVFVDNKRWNITPARKLGIKTIWYRNFKDFYKRFKRLV